MSATRVRTHVREGRVVAGHLRVLHAVQRARDQADDESHNLSECEDTRKRALVLYNDLDQAIDEYVGFRSLSRRSHGYGRPVPKVKRP